MNIFDEVWLLVIWLIVGVIIVWGFVVLLLKVISQQERQNSDEPARATPTTSGNAQQPADQRTGESSQGDSRAKRSSGGGFGWFVGWALTLIVIAVLGHYAWSYYEKHGFSVPHQVSNTPCADYTVDQLDYNETTIFSPYVVSSAEAKDSYPTPPCGANLIYIGSNWFISSLCTENCQTNPDVEGKTLHFQFYYKDRNINDSFFEDPYNVRGIKPLRNGSRVDWVVRHKVPPPSTPATAEYFFVWLVDDTNSGTLRMSAKKGRKR